MLVQMVTPTPSVPAISASLNASAANVGRLDSLDAFRGFTMFWLLGGKAFMIALATLFGIETVRYQLTHSDWEGIRYYDLIWPSFMLMVGVAIPFSFDRRGRTQTRAQLLRDAWKRAAILFLLGSLRASVSEGVPRWIELSSALQPIALAYLVTCYLAGRSVKLQIGVAAAIVAGYALLLACVGTATIPAGSYEKNHNVVTAVDQLVLGRAHPDGWGTVLSVVPTIATTVVGLLFGQVLMTVRAAAAKLKIFILTGLGCLAAGYAVSPVIPIIMKLWTSSYALVVTGWASLLFAAFYATVDVGGWRKWAFPLVVIGTNALAAYLLPTVMPVSRIVGIFTKPLLPALGAFGPLVASGAVLLTGWLILLWLYRRRIFLRP
jgi:predicted acyltransferase